MIHPRIRARLQASCEHRTVLIDATLADLECEACGKQINPYWWIEGLCEDWHRYEKEVKAYEDEVTEKHRGWIAHLNARIKQLHADVDTLEAKKSQLMKEEVRGVSLGQQVRRWRRT